MQTIYRTMSDGISVAVHQWLPDNRSLARPKAVLHIVHGMAEHALRYGSFAEDACKRGFAVFAADHRGHGKSVSGADTLGYLADGDGFRRAVNDQYEINGEIGQNYPNIPIVVIGHSFGSFVTQEYIEIYGHTVKAAVLIGSSGPGSGARAGSAVAALNCFFKGRRAPAKLMHKLVFGAYNKTVEGAETDFDWLSRSCEEVQKYIDDPFCGFVCTAGFYRDLMRGLNRIHKQGAMKKIPADLPILIAAGSEDPVSDKCRTLKTLARVYKELGIQDAELKIYGGARHEILNETNREEVKADILDWIETRAVQP